MNDEQNLWIIIINLILLMFILFALQVPVV